MSSRLIKPECRSAAIALSPMMRHRKTHESCSHRPRASCFRIMLGVHSVTGCVYGLHLLRFCARFCADESCSARHLSRFAESVFSALRERISAVMWAFKRSANYGAKVRTRLSKRRHSTVCFWQLIERKLHSANIL